LQALGFSIALYHEGLFLGTFTESHLSNIFLSQSDGVPQTGTRCGVILVVRRSAN
jgi:hypothetical protein